MFIDKIKHDMSVKVVGSIDDGVHKIYGDGEGDESVVVFTVGSDITKSFNMSLNLLCSDNAKYIKVKGEYFRRVSYDNRIYYNKVDYNGYQITSFIELI